MGEKIFNYWKTYSELTDTFAAAGDFVEAAQAASELVRHYPGNADARLHSARALLRAERFDEADGELARAFELDPSHPEVNCARAVRLREQKKFAEALEAVVSVVRLRPTWDEPAVIRSELLADLGRLPEAIEAAADTAAKFPSSFAARLALLKGLFLAGDPRAEQLFAQCFEAARAQPELGYELAEKLLELRKLDHVIAVCEKLKGDGKLNVPAARSLARAYDEKGNSAAAFAILEGILGVARAPLAVKPALELVRKARPPVGKKKKRSKRVVLVSVNPRVREAKLASALKTVGWETILLYAYEPNYDVSGFFTESKKFITAEHALLLAEQCDAPIHHVFSLHVDEVSLAFVREKMAVTLFDPSDVYDGLIYDEVAVHGAQRYCMTNADGLVCRQLTPRYASRQGGYALAPQILYFPEYCWGEPQVPPAVKKKDEIHLVQTGYIDIERFTGQKAGTALGYFEAFARAGIHVHLYQHLFARGEPIEVVYQDFIRLGQQTGHMHVHPNVPLDKMIAELAAYDLGLLTAISPEEPMAETYKRSLHPLHLRGITASRCTDYLEAGMPVIIDDVYFHQRRLAARYGRAVPFSKDLLVRPREILLPLCTPEVRAEVRRKSAAFTLARHAPRLARFYEQCIERR